MAFLLHLLTSLPYSIKEPGIQTPIRWLLGDISLPYSGSAGFPNEVVFLALTLGLLVNWRIVRQAEDKLTLPPMMIS